MLSQPSGPLSSQPMKILRTIDCCTASARSWNTVSIPASRERAAFQPRDRLAADQDLARGRLDDAGQDLDQRRFSRAVVADQSDDLALVDAEVDAAERIDAPERLGDVAQLDEPLRHRSPSREPAARSPCIQRSGPSVAARAKPCEAPIAGLRPRAWRPSDNCPGSRSRRRCRH